MRCDFCGAYVHYQRAPKNSRCTECFIGFFIKGVGK